MSSAERGWLGVVEDSARMDAWEDAPTLDRSDDRPTRAELADDQAAYTAWLKDYRAGWIRTTSAIAQPLCDKRPDERLSACVLKAEHAGGCVFAIRRRWPITSESGRVTGHRHGAAFYRIPQGAATPEQVHEMTTRYRDPTRSELAEELAWAQIFRVVPESFDEGATPHDRPF